jgi:branched-chain amino acid aminotransferase
MDVSYENLDGMIWVDGELVPWKEAKFHLLTHALHYGSSVFEGERAYGGKIYKSREHSARLIQSGRYIDIDIPLTIDELEEAKTQVLNANNQKDSYVRALAWRGSGPDMGVASARNPVRVAIASWEWGAYYGDAKFKGAKLDISSWKRPSPETIPCFAKAAGLYMICTMSKHAAEAKGCSDSLMLDYRGYVAEATGANIFFVKDKKVYTPKADCFLNGITRQTVIGILKKNGVEVIEKHIELKELDGFQQCWLTGTAAEVTPVGQIDTFKFEVGELARYISNEYEKEVRS